MTSPYAIIADTNRAFGRALRVQLDGVGFVSFVETDLAAVLEHLEQFVPALVLLDVNLPGLGAYQACIRLRRSPGCANLPIVLMGPHARPQVRAAALHAGATGYLVKPFALQDLWRETGGCMPLPRAADGRGAMAAPGSAGVAEPQQVIWTPPPVRPPPIGPAPSAGQHMLDVMRRREAKQGLP